MKRIYKLGLGTLALLLIMGSTASAASLEEQLDLRPQEATRGQSRDVADGWMSLGNEQLAEGNLTEAIDSWTEAAEIYRLLGDGQSAGLAYGSMGAAFANLGRYPEAERAFVLRVGTARDNDDALGQVYGLNNLGNLYVNRGRLLEGQTYFEEALQIARATGDSRAIGVSLSNLGQVATQRGDLDAAVQLLEAATNYRILASDYVGEAHSSNSLGDVYVALGRSSNAIGAYRVALRSGREAGDRGLQIRALDGLLGIYFEREDLAPISDYLNQRAALTLDAGDLQTALTYRWLGDYYLLLENPELASRAFTQGSALARRLNQKSLEAELTNRLLDL
ncbi:tetratricopeptide repeat protein [Nodosilinea sp. LEGE 07088]|uniref:tetratricopeptide repeat protein n=1 Tax=Nodosilinea sp. LEGE 07088 TaxID=2777968 RepID=UPI001882312D|nr:tetratricopeptide repeat protein [Nodosilinea sp. LEGE 07088]MBE9139909.1 tetratricopeptide repeat protein [Nodosilinea sp. LEGE 07088]